MLLLRHNTLSSEDLFIIECLMVKVADPKYSVDDLTHFTVLDKSRAELYGYVLGFCERLGLCESIGVTPSQFLDFLVDIDHGYLPNAYHSFFHAVDVAIVLYHMIQEYDIANYISRIDIAALMIAGLCHDIGHPGKNNNYQVNLKTDLALRYNNKSVLESYSCTLTMDLLTKHKLLRRLESSSASLGIRTTEPEMRTCIIKMILATDMIFHYELQENLANLLEIITDDCPTAEEDVNYHINTIHKITRLASTPEVDENNEDDDDNTNAPKHSSCNHHEPEIQIKDIFSTQGAKSAISYFRKKSYFEEDMIPQSIKEMSILPVSPEEDENTASEADPSSGVVIDDDKPKTATTHPLHYIAEPQQRLILCQIVLHAADISNALRPWPICYAWSNMVCEEFFCQGDAEKEHGLKVSPNMDRSQVSQTTIGLQFGDFVASPYFEIVAALFPKADELVKQLAANRTQWIKLEEQELKDKKESEDGGNERLPTSILPDRPIINPTGRRVSVAAGMVIIPDELEERTIGSGKNKRKYWGVRSVSHSDISTLHRDRDEVVRRRRSEEPHHMMSRRLRLTPMSPRRRSSKEKKQTASSTLSIVEQ